ncbi:hypothetical protein U8V72_11805 [Priestia filamentosa]|uniref:hypothetical protein n=1 Tax=Priestia filamentosa TaxID=1402861 RepID=UPI003978A5B0
MKKEYMQQYYNELKENYKVRHLISPNTKVIFILESPHIDELLNQAPVSGLSGKAMSKVIFNNTEKEALGKVLKREFEEEKKEYSRIGIMNICSIPMQRVAYTNPDVVKMYGEFNSERYAAFFDILEKLRTGTRLTYRDEKRNDLQAIVLDDFVQTLEELKGRNILFIPCGKTAETFLKATNLTHDKWEVMNNIPHPSFGNI